MEPVLRRYDVDRSGFIERREILIPQPRFLC